MKSTFFRAVGVTGVLLWGVSASALQNADPRDGIVAVGGETILTIRFPAAGMTVKQRADAITERLQDILSDPNLTPKDIMAVPISKTTAKITVKNKLLVTVTQDAAKFNGMTTIGLAQKWANNIRNVLPKINVQPNPNNMDDSPKP
jgi:hypothetical protein